MAAGACARAVRRRRLRRGQRHRRAWAAVAEQAGHPRLATPACALWLWAGHGYRGIDEQAAESCYRAAGRVSRDHVPYALRATALAALITFLCRHGRAAEADPFLGEAEEAERRVNPTEEPRDPIARHALLIGAENSRPNGGTSRPRWTC